MNSLFPSGRSRLLMLTIHISSWASSQHCRSISTDFFIKRLLTFLTTLTSASSFLKLVFIAFTSFKCSNSLVSPVSSRNLLWCENHDVKIMVAGNEIRCVDYPRLPSLSWAADAPQLKHQLFRQKRKKLQ